MSLEDGALVYFVQSTRGGPVKIGYVHRDNLLAPRLSALQTGSPYPLRVLKTIPGGRYVEREMHERFKDWRLGGEWFLASRDIISFCGGATCSRAEQDALSRATDAAFKRGYDAGLSDGEAHGYDLARREVAKVLRLSEPSTEAEILALRQDVGRRLEVAS